METYKRVFVIVLDSLGIGAMPDSEKFGDKGVDTFGHILDKITVLFLYSYLHSLIDNVHLFHKLFISFNDFLL